MRSALARRLGRCLPDGIRRDAFEPAVADLEFAWAAAARAGGPAPGRWRRAAALAGLWIDCLRLALLSPSPRLPHAHQPTARRDLPAAFMLDLRHALRLLRREPGFAAAAVLTLALGVGANPALFAVVEAVLLGPLPYPDAEALVLVKHRDARTGLTKPDVAIGDFVDLGARQHVFSAFAGYYGFQAALTGEREVDPGFTADGVLTAQVGLPAGRYREAPARAAAYQRLFAALEALPGVERVGGAAVAPLTGNNWTSPLVRPEQPLAAGQRPPEVGWQLASAGYFEALRIPLRAGRLFDGRDTPDSPPVVIVSDALAAQFFPGEDPVGRRIVLGDATAEIVGRVGDIRAPRSPTRHARISTSRSNGRTATASRCSSVPLAIRWPPGRRFAPPCARSNPRRSSPRCAPWSTSPPARPRCRAWRCGCSAASRSSPWRWPRWASTACCPTGSSGGLASWAHGWRWARAGARCWGWCCATRRASPARVWSSGSPPGSPWRARCRRSSNDVAPGDPPALAAAVVVLALTALAAGYLPARRASRVDPATALAAD
jgi:hypothetical protein